MGRSLTSAALLALFAGGAASAFAEDDEAGAPAPEIPVCTQSLGAVRIVDGDRAGWVELELPAPSALLRAVVQRSHCFTLATDGAEAGYVLMAELAGQNEPAQQNVTQFVGSMLDARWSGLMRDASTPRQGPQAELTLMQVGSAERAATARARAFEQDPNWAQGASLRLGAVGRAWEENEIGRMVSGAYIDAYAQMVAGLGGLDRASAPAGAAPIGLLRTRRDANLRDGPGTNYAVLRRTASGEALTATGARTGDWVHVTDGSGAEAWIHRDLVVPGS